MSPEDENTLRLVVDHGGDDLRQRLQFCLTNATKKLVTKPLIEET
jgi:hypothetical protein